VSHERLEVEFRDLEEHKKALNAIFRNLEQLLAKWEAKTSSSPVRSSSDNAERIVREWLVFSRLDDSRMEGLDAQAEAAT
jgi:hypothetical protein